MSQEFINQKLLQNGMIVFNEIPDEMLENVVGGRETKKQSSNSKHSDCKKKQSIFGLRRDC